MFDFATLMLLWWALLAVLLLGFTLLNGFDLGIAMLLPVVGRSDAERHAAIRIVRPGWTGHPLWMLLGGGAVMAAWPVYATDFSIHYLALLLTLGALFVRPLGFDLRKRTAAQWRPLHDHALQLAALLPALLFGMAIGDLFCHAPQRLLHSGGVNPNLARYLHPFTLYCGMVSVMLLLMHGAAMLVLRTGGAVQRRGRGVAMFCGLTVGLLFTGGGWWIAELDGLLLDRSASQAPMAIRSAPSAWLVNFSGGLWLLPASGLAAAIAVCICAWRRWRWATFVASCTTLGAVMATAGLALFPFVLPPTQDVRSNLALWQAASSHPRLCQLLTLVLIALPLLTALAMRSAGGGHGSARQRCQV